MAVARSSSDGIAVGYVLPVFWITSCFHIIEARIKDDAYASSSSPDGGTSPTSDNFLVEIRGIGGSLMSSTASCVMLCVIMFI